MVSNIKEALGTNLRPSKKNSIKLCRKEHKVQQDKSKLADLCLQTECENGDTKLNLKTSSVCNL